MRYKLADVAEINPSNSVNISSFEKIRYLDTANLNQGKIDKLVEYTRGIDKVPSRAKRLVKCNDILYSTVRPNQKHFGIYKYQAEIIASTGFAHLRVDINKADPDYVYWLLTQEKVIDYLQAIAEASTSTYPSIKPSVIGHLEFDFPSLIKQKKAVEVLNNISRKIDINNQLVKRLEDISQTIYKQWFIDFEFPNEQGQPYKSSGGKMVESELGLIPEEFEVNTITTVAEIIMGQSPKGDTYNYYGEGLPLVNGAADFKEGLITPNKFTTDPKKVALKDDYIFGVRATIGGVTSVDKEYAIGRGAGIARFKDTKFKEFLYFILEDAFNKFEKTSSGSVYLNVSGNDLKKIKFIMPNEAIMSLFSEKVRSMFELLNSLREQNIHLQSLRDSLLPKLLSGEIELPIKETVEN